jgi:hypothetical protein
VRISPLFKGTPRAVPDRGGKEGAVRGTVTDAPLLEADHGRGGAGPGATRGEDAHTEMRRRKLSEEPRTVTNVHVVPPSLSSR